MPIRILHLEDDSSDAELVQALLLAEGLPVAVQWVATRGAFVAALQQSTFDLILTDYSLPGFNGLAALALAQQYAPEVPFVFVTGVLEEEKAIETLRNGATDYVYKNRLNRLVPAVRRALREAGERAARQQAQAAAQAEREWLRVTLSSIGDAVIATNTDGRVTFLNAVAEGLTGWSQAEAAGRPIGDVLRLVDEQTRQSTESLATTLLASRTRSGPEAHTLLVRRDGREIPIDDSSAPIRADDGRLIGAVLVFRDVTERRRAEIERSKAAAALAARARQQAVVAELGQRALAGLALPELMQDVVHKVAATLQVEFCEILELVPDGTALRLTAGQGLAPDLVGTATTSAGPESEPGYTLRADQPVITADLATETRFTGPLLLRGQGVVSGMSTVIRGAAQPFGVLGAHSRQRRDFSADDGSFLQSAANVLAEALERHEAEAALRKLTLQLDRALAEAELLNVIASDTSGESDLGRLLRVALDHLRRVVAFTGGSIALIEGQNLVVRAAVGPFAETALGQRLPRGSGASWRVIETGLPFFSNDLRGAGLSPTTPIRSYVAVPLNWRGQHFGLLEVDSAVPDAFSPGDEFLLRRVATVLSGSIQLAQLHGELEQRVLARTAELLAANEKLQRSERQLAEAQQIAELGSWRWDVISNTVSWSDELYLIYGLRPESFGATYEGFLQLLHPDDRPMVEAVIAHALDDHQPFTFDHRLLRPDGDERSLHVRGEVTVDSTGAPVLLTGVALDITERKRIENALRTSREELRRLSSHLEAAREEERKRIAREVHDELGGAMTALKMDVSRLAKLGSELNAQQLAERTRQISRLIDDTIKTVRRIATDLRPGILDDLGLLPAIEWELQEFETRSGIECRLTTTMDEVDLGPDRSTAVFRVFQETLTNVARHAQATRVEVALDDNGDHLLLQVRDNGRGISERELAGSKSLGLLGMRERVRLLAGKIDIDGRPGQGTTVRLKIPLEPAPAPPVLSEGTR